MPRNGPVLIVKVSTYDFKTLRPSIRATGYCEWNPLLDSLSKDQLCGVLVLAAQSVKQLSGQWFETPGVYVTSLLWKVSKSLFFLYFIARLRFQDFFFMSKDHSVQMTIWNEFIGPFPNPVALVNHKTGFLKWLGVKAVTMIHRKKYRMDL